MLVLAALPEGSEERGAGKGSGLMSVMRAERPGAVEVAGRGDGGGREPRDADPTVGSVRMMGCPWDPQMSRPAVC